MLNDVPAVGACLLLLALKPCTQTGVAVGVATGKDIWFVKKSLANLACDKASQGIEIGM